MAVPTSSLHKLQRYFKNEELIARFYFFLLGAAMLLPWNVYITAVDYFGLLFPDEHIDRVFSVVYMSVNIVSIALNLYLQRYISIPARMKVGLVGYVFCLIAVPVADSASASGSLGSYSTPPPVMFNNSGNAPSRG